MYSLVQPTKQGWGNNTPVKILAYKYHFLLGLIGEVVDSRAEVGRESTK